MLSLSVPAAWSDERNSASEGPPEASPLWPLVLILGEIAERVERRQEEEHADEEST